jgi:hypothetical protein
MFIDQPVNDDYISPLTTTIIPHMGCVASRLCYRLAFVWFELGFAS